MKKTILLASVLGLAACALAEPAAQAASQPGRTTILDTSGFWRLWYTYKPPVVREGQALKPLATLTGDTPAPPTEWAAADFDDSLWTRSPGKPFPAFLLYKVPEQMLDAGFVANEYTSPALAGMYLRGKFKVADPAAAGDLAVDVAFRGGAIVYINGKEVGRASMPKDATGPDAVADDYPPQAFFKADGSLLGGHYFEKQMQDKAVQDGWVSHVRRATIPIPANALRPGVNVLAVEIHRAAYPADWVAKLKEQQVAVMTLPNVVWSTCGLAAIRLTGAGPGGVAPNVARPAGIQVWNSQLMQPDFDLDYGDPNEPLGPLRLVGPRGGVCSGKVVVGSAQPIQGLKAEITEFALGGTPKRRVLGGGDGPEDTPKRTATALGGATQVRYALPSGWEFSPQGRYPVAPEVLDGLAEKPPAVVPVRAGGRKAADCYIAPGQPNWVFGAVAPVWVTVAIPADTPPGEYEAALTVSAEGLPPVKTAVKLKVCPWQSPPPDRFGTVVDFVESPESVALQYGVPLYGDKHFELLAKSFDRLRHVGNWTLYVPLICKTDQGNEQSLVRWVKSDGAGGYKHDFTLLGRYLDVAEKHMGRPRILCLYVWDLFVGGSTSRHENDASPTLHGKDLAGTGVPVTLMQPGGELQTLELPVYDEKTEAAWKALLDPLMARLKQRGLDKAVMLGMASEGRPTKEIAAFWAKLLPGVPWMRHGHQEWKQLGSTGVPMGYQSTVTWTKFLGNIDKGQWSLSGWKRPDNRALLWRTPDPALAWDTARLLGEINIVGWQRGFGRIGLDFWPVLKDAKGQPKATLLGRYPESTWGGFDGSMIHAFVPPGPDGALGTGKLELMREGLQEAEARIFLEKALADPAGRAKLGAALCGQAQQVLDDRVRSWLPDLEEQHTAGFVPRLKFEPLLHGYSTGFYAECTASIFHQWYRETGWQDRTEKLFSIAGQVADKLGGP